MNARETALSLIWETLDPRAAQPLIARRVGGLDVTVGIYLALDALGQRVALIGCARELALPFARRTRALEVSFERQSFSGLEAEQMLVLRCHQPEFHGLFLKLVSEIVDAVTKAQRTFPPADIAIQIVGKWRKFWDVDPQTLTAERALGLFGELFFLSKWLGVSDQSVEGWCGARSERHDFVFKFGSVEVKSCVSAAGPSIHRIGSLDQLVPSDLGPLLLFSLRVREEKMASLSLETLVSDIRSELGADSPKLSMFDEQLLELGYTPHSAELHNTQWRIMSTGLFEVGPDFPCLRPSFLAASPALSSAVVNVTYDLDMSGCAAWLKASDFDARARDALEQLRGGHSHRSETKA